MTEPHKIYISRCQESPSYGDTTFSRNFTYKMNSFTKSGKSRRVLRRLLCIFGFLLIAFLFTIIGMFIYSKLIGHCKNQVSSDHEENQNNYHYIPSFSDILNGMGMCKESHNHTFTEEVNINKSKTQSSFKNEDANFLIHDECNCLNSSQKLNTLSEDDKQDKSTKIHMVEKCVCNETMAVDNFVKIKAGNESKSYQPKIPNEHEITPSKNIHINDSGTLDKISYLEQSECDCTNVQKMDNHTFNGEDTENASFEADSNCNCSENIRNKIEVNDTESSKKDTVLKPSDIRKCHCPNGTLNEPELDEKLLNDDDTKLNGCICSETLKMPIFDDNEVRNESIKNGLQSADDEGEQYVRNFHFNEADFVSENIKQSKESFNAAETNSKVNLHLNETETVNENLSQINEKCTCPKTRYMTYELFNGTQLSDESYDLALKEDVVCNCPELHDDDNFNKNETETRAKDNIRLSTEACVCPDITEMQNSESTIEGNKRGFKMANGECVCPETLKIPNVNDNKVNNGSMNYKTESFNSTDAFQTISLPFNETENVRENDSLASNKCICPKPHEVSDTISNETSDGFEDFVFSREDGCVCTSADTENINNFDQHEAETEIAEIYNQSLKAHECVCPEEPVSQGKASVVANKKLGLKTENGDCLCPEIMDIEDIHGNQTETMNEQEFIHKGDNNSMSVTELINGPDTESILGTEPNFGDEITTINVKGLRSSSERDNENKKESSYGDEKDSSHAHFVKATSVYDQFYQSEKK